MYLSRVCLEVVNLVPPTFRCTKGPVRGEEVEAEAWGGEEEAIAEQEKKASVASILKEAFLNST